jgi:hypothetical protein
MTRCDRFTLLALCMAALVAIPEKASGQTMLIDDFSQANGVSAMGTAWRGFTDRVMGGRSDMQAGYVDGPDGPALRLRGQVRLDNNGGFIQARLPLSNDGANFDASEYRGIAVRARGQPGPYYLHLRTRDTRRPWQYYRAQIPLDEEWRDVVIPFSDFEGQSIRSQMDVRALQSLGVVAYGEAFEAEIEVARLEWAP